jgi:oxygen-independent coproporphyrinogen III oxidase
MDHFALPTDELAIAQQTGALHRNFQGYSTRPECDLVAFGISAR